MRTLLELFFLPYLRFLGKFHLWALPVAALMFLVKIPELMMLMPMLYMFALYTTMNRHQFKENIPWMLATFNKKTLVRYHLFAQTLVLLCQGLLSATMMVLYFSVMILVAPESSDQLLPEVGGKGAQAVLTRGISPLAGTKEQLVLAVVAVFFLITMYSPVSLKDYLRQLEERRQQKSFKRQARDASFLAMGAGLLFVLQPARFMGPLLSFILVAEIAYVVWMFNRAFVLFHPRFYRQGFLASAVSAVLVAAGVQWTALSRFHHNPHAEVRLSELHFMGALAPHVSSQQFTALAGQIKDPSFVVELMGRPEWARLVAPAQLRAWILESKELGVALRLVRTLPAEQLQVLSAEVWPHLDKLYVELNERNPASAQFQAKTLERALARAQWKPRVGQRGPLEQVVSSGVEERLRAQHERRPASGRP